MKLILSSLALAALALPAQAALVNGDFSQGKKTYSTPYDFSVSTDNAGLGARAGVASNDAFGVLTAGTAKATSKWTASNGEVYKGSLLGKTVTLAANEQLSFDWAISRVTSSPFVALLLDNKKNVLLNLSDLFYNNATSSDWQTATWTPGKAYAGSVTFLVAQDTGYTNQTRLLLDNLQVAPVPEPETYALMGIGLLAAWARRRKQKQQSTTPEAIAS